MLKKIFFIFALIVFAFFQMDEVSAATKSEMQDAIRNDVDAKYDAYDKCRGQSCESATLDAYNKAFKNYDDAWGGKTTIESAYNNLAGSSSNSANDPTATEVNNIEAKPEFTTHEASDGSVLKEVSVPGDESGNATAAVYDKNGNPTGDIVTETANGNVTVTGPDGSIKASCDSSNNCTGDANSVAMAKDAASALGGDDGGVITTENVPGGNCTCHPDANGCNDPLTKKYICKPGKGLQGFQDVFAQIIRYVINITLLLGVLAVAGLGVAWSFAGGDDIKMKSTLKKWAINIIIGLAILFMFSYILTFLAPWVYE